MPPTDNITFIDASKFAEAYESFARGQQGIIDQLYAKFHEYNQQYWGGQLPRALIRVPSHGMTRRTLGRYTRKNDQGEEHLIEINKDFLVLNSWERVLETLRHEMIHLYLLGVVNEHGCKGHGKRFKDEADRVGIPCIGPRGYGNPAKMPAPKTSYAEWKCGCGAVSVRCSESRTVQAICDRCWSPLREDGYTPGEYTAPSVAPINGGQSLLVTFAQTLEAAANATSSLSSVEAERDEWRREAQDLLLHLFELSFTAIVAYEDPLTAARRRSEAVAEAGVREGHDPGVVHRFARVFAELEVNDAAAPVLLDGEAATRLIELEPEVTLNGRRLVFADEEEAPAPRAPVDLTPGRPPTPAADAAPVRPIELD